MLSDEQYGTPENYYQALHAILAEGLPDKHRALLAAHAAAPNQTATWARLAERVGYKGGSSVNLQYGILAHRVASRLGVTEPLMGFWLHVLVDWANVNDASGHTTFILRPAVCKAAARLGLTKGNTPLRSIAPLARGRARTPISVKMEKLTTTIQREWLREIVAGRKTVEYREVKPYWTKRLQNIQRPFLLRLINGMTARAPEVTVQIDRVRKNVASGNYELHIARVVEVRNWNKRSESPAV